MNHSNNIQDELNEFSPSLSKMEKQEGFQVPPRYFDHLSEEVIRKMNSTNTVRKEEEKNSLLSVFVNTIQSLWHPRLVIGLATVVLLFIGVRQFLPDQINDREAIAFETLTDEEYASYIAENIYEFEDDLLIEIVKDVPYFPETIGDEELDDYFKDINEDLDFSAGVELL